MVHDCRMADLDPNYKICEETSKTKGKYAYGKCIVDKTKHNAVTFVEETNLDIHIMEMVIKLSIQRKKYYWTIQYK